MQPRWGCVLYNAYIAIDIKALRAMFAFLRFVARNPR